MNDPIQHLPGIQTIRQRSEGIEIFALTSGPSDGEPVLFLHGNLSSSTIWEEMMVALPDRYRAVAIDLRGYGATDSTAHIDATRGVAGWADDVRAFADTMHWDRFHLVAHSLGGCVGWALLGAHPERIASATLFAPGPPCGFGGSHGARGALNHTDGAGSGAALVHPELIRRIAAGEREVLDENFSPRSIMNRLFWNAPFRAKREEQILSGLLQVHIGPQQFPGDWESSPHWPGFSPGRHGPINALAPRYNRWVLPQLIAASTRPRLLCICGADDLIISDESGSDAGYQGKLGLRENWPGESIFPPQPFQTQVLFALDQHESRGGHVQRVEFPGVGHTPYLEREQDCIAALVEHLS